MRRLITSFLAAGGLLLAPSALLAQDGTPKVFVSQDYEAEGVAPDWTSSNGSRFVPVIMEDGQGGHFLSVDQGTRDQNGSTQTGKTFCPGDEQIVGPGVDFTLSFDMKLCNSNNQTPVNFFINDWLGNDWAAEKKVFNLSSTGTWVSTWVLNGGDVIDLPGTGCQGGTDIKDASIPWYNVVLTRKTYGDKVMSFVTITSKADANAIISKKVVPNMSETGGLGWWIADMRRYNANFALDNILVREVVDADVPAGDPIAWQVKYVNEEGAEIAEPAAGLGFAGDVIVANAAQAADFIDPDSQKWIYVSGNDEKSLSAEDNVITLVFRKAAKLHYTINAVDAEGNVLKELANDSILEKEKASVAFPQNILVENDELYATNAINKEYNKYAVITTDNQVETVVYNKSLDFVAFYAEAEDIPGLTVNNGSTINIRGSQSAGAHNASEDAVPVMNLEPGKYKLTFATFRNGSADGEVYFQVGEVNDKDTLKIAVSGGNYISPHTPDTVITVESDANVYMLPVPTAAPNNLLDYLYARYETAKVDLKVTNEAGDSITTVSFEAPTYEASGKTYSIPEDLLTYVDKDVKVDSTINHIDTTYVTEVDLVTGAIDTIETIYTNVYDYTYQTYVLEGGNLSSYRINANGTLSDEEGQPVANIAFVDERTQYAYVKVSNEGLILSDTVWFDGLVNEYIQFGDSIETAFEKDEFNYAYISGNEGRTLVADKDQNIFEIVFKAANLQYTVKFIDRNTSAELKDAETSYALPGVVVKANSAQKADFTVGDLTYSLFDPTDSIKVEDGAENTLSLIFGLTTGYSVKTVDEDGNALADVKEYTGLFVGDSVVAEEASLADITKDDHLFQLVSGNEKIGLDTTNNVITLVFAQKTAHYTVNFMTPDGVKLAESVVAEANVGETVAPKLSQLQALNVAGVEYVSVVKDPSEVAIVLGKNDEENVINLFFVQNTTTYTVRFVADVDGRDLKDAEKVANVKPGDKVAAAVDKLGDIKNEATDNETFTYVSGNDSIVLDTDADKNVITLVYTQKTTKYAVRYVNAENVEVGKALLDQAGNVGDTVKVARKWKSNQLFGGVEYVLDEEASAEVLANGIVLVANAEANVVTLVFKVPGQDAIVYISADKAKENGPIYSLNGAIVVNPTRGLYVQNGQIIMIK